MPTSLLSFPLDIADDEPNHITVARQAIEKLDLLAARQRFEKDYDAKIQQWVDNREKQWQWQLKLWATEVSRNELLKSLSEREPSGDAPNREKHKPFDELADDVYAVVLSELKKRWETISVA